MVCRGMNDTNQRNFGPALHIIKHQMWRVRRDAGEIRTRTYELIYAVRKIVNQLADSTGIKHRYTLIGIEAADQYVWVFAIVRNLTISRQNGAVIVDRRLGPKPTEYAEGSHVKERCEIG